LCSIEVELWQLDFLRKIQLFENRENKEELVRPDDALVQEVQGGQCCIWKEARAD